MSTIVKAASAAEFLSLVPRMLGYVPARSLVMIPFDGSRSLGAMRFDLPDDAADAVDRVAATVIGMVCRLPAADAVAMIAYTDEAFGGERMPHLDLFDALRRRTDACGLRTTDVLCVAADGWASGLDSDAPAGGRPLSELEVVPAGAEDIEVAEHDQASGAELPEIGLLATERVGRALVSFERAVGLLCGDDAGASAAGATAAAASAAGAAGRGGRAADWVRDEASDDRVDPGALAAVCALDDLPALFEDALEWSPPQLEPFDAAALVWCLSRPSLRDVALVQWTGTLADGDEAFEAQLRWEAGEEYPTHFAMRMWGEGDRPDVDRLERALELSRHVAASAPRISRPGPLALCAWLSWALGRSTHADRYASEACSIEPEHGLGEIVRSFVLAGHLPDWAFRPAEGGSSR